MKNNAMNFMKAFGIIFVVIGHLNYQHIGTYSPLYVKGPILALNGFLRVPELFFPPYSFHLALFFFVSGYFYNEKYEFEVRNFLGSRFKRLILPYFAYNLIYAIITFLLYEKYGLTLGKLPDLRNFFLEPFIDGHQYMLFLPSWFVPQLVIVQIVFLSFRRSTRSFLNSGLKNLPFFLIVCVLGLYLAIKPVNITAHPLQVVLIRTSFGLFFYFLGLFYKAQLEFKGIFKAQYFVLLFAFQSLLIYIYKDITYELTWVNFRGHIIAPIMTSIFGIYICLYAAKALDILNKDRLLIKLFNKIGDNTYHIMANHLFVFFIISYIAIRINGSDVSELKNIWYRPLDMNMYGIVYASLGVLLPTALGLFFVFCERKLKKAVA